jgi:hypothetical protein
MDLGTLIRWLNAYHLARTSPVAALMGVCIVLFFVFYIPYYYWDNYQKEKIRAYHQDAVYAAEKNTVRFPKQFYNLYQENPKLYNDIYGKKGMSVEFRSSSEVPLTEEIQEFYNNQYKDIDNNLVITQKELDKWDSDENAVIREVHFTKRKELLEKYPHLKDVIFDGFSDMLAYDIVRYSEEFPTSLRFLRETYKDDPELLQRILFHGLNQSFVRRNLKGDFSKKEVQKAEVKNSNGINLWVKI